MRTKVKGTVGLGKETITRRSFLKTIGIASLSLGMEEFGTTSIFAADEKRFINCNPTDITTLDPAMHFDNARVAARLNFYDGLFRWRDMPIKLEPWLATSVKNTPDLLRWTVSLRKGVKFHDGTELISEDVVYSIERLIALKSGAAAVFIPIIEPKSTIAVDRYTVEFNLNKSYAPFIGMTHFLNVLNKKVLLRHEKEGDWGTKWLGMTGSRLGPNGVGSGSFTVERFNPAEGFDGVRFKDHFAAWNHPHLEKIGFRPIKESASRLLGLMKGDYHAEQSYFLPEQLRQAKESPNIQIIKRPTMLTFFMSMNCELPPTNDIHFRKAMCYAFDYEGWNKGIMEGEVEGNIGPIPNPMWGSLDPEKEFGYKYDLNKAREELKQVKVDFTKYFPIEMVTLTAQPKYIKAAEFMQGCLQRIGVETRVVQKTWPVITDICRRKETTPILCWNGRGTYYPDPDSWIGAMFHSNKIGTVAASSRYSNPKVDELLNNALKVFEREEREKLYKEASRLVVADAAAMFVNNDRWIAVFNKDLRGMRFCPAGYANEYRWYHWAK